MKITQFRSSTFIIESNNKKILFDPWLVNGEYYGSWYQYPEYDLEKNREKFDVDYICITHIHPDHFSRKTLAKLNKDIPVIILKYNQKFLKFNLEKLGFKVQEIENESSFKIGNLDLFFFAADNCDPKICQKVFGCGNFSKNINKNESNFIDSIIVIKDNVSKNTLINANDCLFEMAKTVSYRIKKKFLNVDLLMTGYSGAGAYPQCFKNLNNTNKFLEGKKKRDKFLNNALSFIDVFKPNYTIPFAGQYELSGKLSKLNDYRGVPNLLEAKSFINLKSNTNCLLPYFEKEFSIESLADTKEIDISYYDGKKKYLKKISSFKFDYEKKNDKADIASIKKLIPNAYDNFERKRKELVFSSETQLYIELTESFYLLISFNGKSYSYETKVNMKLKKYIILKLDLRLLKLILMGPKYAHWNNAEIGSHITFYRKPDSLYERGMHYCMNFFHN